MNVGRLVRFLLAGVVSLGMTILGPAASSATNMWADQAIILVHVPLGGGLFFTTNHVFTASAGGNTAINVKCFNDAARRIGPAAGVTILLGLTGQLAQETPATLGVISDPLFRGFGWCWASNVGSGLDFNVQTTVGATDDLSPGGLLSSSPSTLVAANTGLAETSANLGGIPFFTTDPGAVTFVFLVNPLAGARTVGLQLFSDVGVPQAAVVLNLAGRMLALVSVPAVFGLTPPTATGSVRMTANGNGYLGWVIQGYPGDRLTFTAIGLDGNDRNPLSPTDRP